LHWADIATIVGIVSTVSAWPIFKVIINWLKEQQRKKLVRTAKVITDANKPFIDVYEREHAAVIDDIKEAAKTKIQALIADAPS